MTVAEIIGWAALVLNIWGNMLLTKKRTVGWPVRLIANGAWLVYSFWVFAWPLFANHVIFTVINVVGWRRWSQEQTYEQEWVKVLKATFGRKR